MERFIKVHRVLTPDGSFVLDLGGAHEKGCPVRSLYNDFAREELGMENTIKVSERAELPFFYQNVHACTQCIMAPGCLMQQDSIKVPRQTIERAIESRVFIVGQALGSSTQRLSGIPYITEAGKLSRTGLVLDSILTEFGYSIDPLTHMNYAYASDMVKCYPGRDSGGDRLPTETEKNNCADWLDEELELVAPDVILVLGRWAMKHFLKRYLDITHTVEYASFLSGTLGTRKMTVMGIPHPAFRRRKPQFVDQLYSSAAKQIEDFLARSISTSENEKLFP